MAQIIIPGPPPLSEILKRASTHPFYSDTPILTLPDLANDEDVTSTTDITTTTTSTPSTNSPGPTFSSFPLLNKQRLTSTIHTLLRTHPPFLLRGSYLSNSGGSRSVANGYFPTATLEMRYQRFLCGRLLRTLAIFTPTDVVANMHAVNPMYKSHNLTGELVEWAGATMLSVTSAAGDGEALELMDMFGATVMFSNASRALQLARWVAGVGVGKEGGKEEGEGEELRLRVQRVKGKLKKLVYTSERLSPQQEVFLSEALGIEYIASLYGSAEAGPVAVSRYRSILQKEDIAHLEHGDGSSLTSTSNSNSNSDKDNLLANREYRDFVVDRKAMIMEIVDETTGTVLSSSEPDLSFPANDSTTATTGHGHVGELVLTSLTKYTHPLIRYRTGDIGSLHPYTPPSSPSSSSSSSSDFVIFRLYGRNPLKSFTIASRYIDLDLLWTRCLSRQEFDVLEWQVLVDRLPPQEFAQGGDDPDDEGALVVGDHVEVRVVTKRAEDVVGGYEERLRRDLVKMVFGAGIRIVVKKVGYEDLVRARNAPKVLRFVDRRVWKGGELERRLLG